MQKKQTLERVHGRSIGSHDPTTVEEKANPTSKKNGADNLITNRNRKRIARKTTRDTKAEIAKQMEQL